MFNILLSLMRPLTKRSVAMSDKKLFSSKNDVEFKNCHSIHRNFRPTPEEGRRLMRAFFSISDAKVREAVIRYAEEQLQLARNG